MKKIKIKGSWDNVQGEYFVETIIRDGKVLTFDGKHLEMLDGFFVNEEAYYDITISFLASGCQEEAVMWPVERSQPAFRDEERVLESVVVEEWLEGAKDKAIKHVLPQNVAERIFDLFRKDIENVELDYGDDPHDYDDYH